MKKSAEVTVKIVSVVLGHISKKLNLVGELEEDGEAAEKIGRELKELESVVRGLQKVVKDLKGPF